jgi:hypothetical protein
MIAIHINSFVRPEAVERGRIHALLQPTLA